PSCCACAVALIPSRPCPSGYANVESQPVKPIRAPETRNKGRTTGRICPQLLFRRAAGGQKTFKPTAAPPPPPIPPFLARAERLSRPVLPGAALGELPAFRTRA